MVQQDLPAGVAVAAGVVVGKADVQIVAEGVEPVVGQSRQQPAAHLAGAGVAHLRLPGDAVAAQAFGEHRQVERRVVGDEHPALHNRGDGLPQGGEGRLAGDRLRRDAGEGDVERVEPALRVDEGGVLRQDAPALDDGNADGAHPVAGGVWGLHIKGDISVRHRVCSFSGRLIKLRHKYTPFSPAEQGPFSGKTAAPVPAGGKISQFGQTGEISHPDGKRHGRTAGSRENLP